LDHEKKEHRRRARFIKKKYKKKNYAEKEERPEMHWSGSKDGASDPQAIIQYNLEADRHARCSLGTITFS
jgi:hypothetical protein